MRQSSTSAERGNPRSGCCVAGTVTEAFADTEQRPSFEPPSAKRLDRVLIGVRCSCGVKYPLVAIGCDEERLCFTCGRALDGERGKADDRRFSDND